MADIVRNYKDRLFCDLFSQRDNALSLYNALNGTDYKDAGDLQIVTLEDAIYLSMNNDVGILCHDVLELWEHQSTINPNIPLRGLMYFAREYEGWLSANEKDIYGSAPIKIPAPRFYVLYNGAEHMGSFARPKQGASAEAQDDTESSDDLALIRLSDLFAAPSKGFEWTATVVNINAGHSGHIMDKCPVLHDYAVLIEKIRNNQDTGMALIEAAKKAIDDCIEQKILKEYLLKTKGEVLNMILTEYNEELHNKTLRNEGREEGIEVGIEVGIEKGITMAYANIYINMRRCGYGRAEAQKITMLPDDQVEALENTLADNCAPPQPEAAVLQEEKVLF